MTNLWEEASRDHQAEIDSLMNAQASVATARFWPFLAQAETEREFGHRLACVRESITAAMDEVMVEERHQKVAFARLLEDYRTLAATKTASRKTGSAITDLVNTLRGRGYSLTQPSAMGYFFSGPQGKVLVQRHGADDYAVSAGDGSGDIAWYTGPTLVEGVQMWLSARTASRKTAASDVSVGSQVIWTDFGVPDFKDEVFMTGRAQNGQPWEVTKIETLYDFVYDVYPMHHQTSEAEHVFGFAIEWIRKHPYTGISDDPEALEVAHISRGGDEKVVPVGALSLSSVEVGKGQGVLPGLASKKTATKIDPGLIPGTPVLVLGTENGYDVDAVGTVEANTGKTITIFFRSLGLPDRRVTLTEETDWIVTRLPSSRS